MELLLNRLIKSQEETIGILYVDEKATCFSLEDEHREVKVYGETRIPSGRYQIKLRTEGGMHKRYALRFGDRHRGMLWLQDVPNFEWIYIHIGNDDADTDACILVAYGAEIKGKWYITNSTEAYIDLATAIYAAMDAGEEVWITVKDEEIPWTQ